MNREDIRLLYEYNRWANRRVLESSSALDAEQFTRDLSSSHRSVRDTLAHIVAGEWIWLERWKGVSPRALFDPAEFPDVPAVKARWDGIEREQTAFLEDLTDAALTRVISYVNTQGEPWRYPLWQMMQHLANHSTYHRGQVAAMLRQLGTEPTSTDFLVFFDERRVPP